MRALSKVIFFLSCGCFLNSCSRQQDQQAPAMGEFPVTVVNSMDVVTDLSFVADIQAFRNVEIRARVNGYLEQIYVDEGKNVSEGQLLFRINDEEYKAQLNRAEANLKSAEAQKKTAEVEMERVRLLVDKNVIAKTEMDLAMAKLDVAKASIEQSKAEETSAKVKLQHANVRSPFSGVIDRIPLKLGSLISEGTLLTTISDISSMNIYFQVSEIQYLTYVATNANALDTLKKIKVELELADGTIYSSKGKIETIESEFEAGTGVLSLRARFENPDRLLKHGSTGKVKIKKLLNGALVIPQKSVMEIQDKNYVFVVDDKNLVMLKSFTPLDRVGDFYVVKDGLKSGERIIYEGVQNLKEGTVIRPMETKLSEIYSMTNN